MREEPSDELVDLLGRLQLANAAQVREAHSRAKRLAVGLPLFSSVWVDALVQVRRLTPFQAREINAGRGEQLAVGPFVLLEPPRRLGYAVSHRGRDLNGGGLVDLLVGPAAIKKSTEPQGGQTQASQNRLTELVQRLAAIDHPGILPATQAGDASGRQWISFAPLATKTLAELLLKNGRFPWPAVAEIARQMLGAVDALKRGGLAHGDISVSSVAVGGGGTVQLSRAGIRGLWRPDERATADDFPPESFDYLAPERLMDAALSTTASDLYACGLLWWHLLTGRCPLAGGDVRTKLRAVQSGKIEDVRRLAPDTPDWLAEAIKRCTQRDPQSRLRSVADDLQALIGVSTLGGRRLLNGICRSNSAERHRRLPVMAGAMRLRRSRACLAALAGSVLAVLITCAVWPGGQPSISSAAPDRPQHNNSTAGVELSPSAHTTDMRLAASRPQEAHHQQNTVERATFLARADDETSTSPMQRTPTGHGPTTAAPAPWILPSDKPVICNGGSWSALEPGQTVRGRPGSRPLLLVPPGGVLVAAEDVRFENVDFGWLQPPDAMANPERLAMVELRAARATFQGCTFQAEPLKGLGAPVAIGWSGPVARAGTGASGRLRLSQCVFRGVTAGIEWRLGAPGTMQINDTLQLGPGALVCFPHLPPLEEPASIVLNHLTLRTANGLLELHSERSADEAAPIQVRADECAFAPGEGCALLLAAGTADPRTTARTIDWSGQGSLLTTGTAVAARNDRGRIQPLGAAELSIDGLVSSRVEFAGSPLLGAVGSRILRWQAPVESADPPGIDDALPALPPLRSFASEQSSLDKSVR